MLFGAWFAHANPRREAAIASANEPERKFLLNMEILLVYE
jgi:hypothetical protein